MPKHTWKFYKLVYKVSSTCCHLVHSKAHTWLTHTPTHKIVANYQNLRGKRRALFFWWIDTQPRIKTFEPKQWNIICSITKRPSLTNFQNLLVSNDSQQATWLQSPTSTDRRQTGLTVHCVTLLSASLLCSQSALSIGPESGSRLATASLGK